MTNLQAALFGYSGLVIFSVIRHSDFALKNYRPPHPIGVKGGCSPQNNREKLGGY
jgi:hypothetical protein